MPIQGAGSSSGHATLEAELKEMELLEAFEEKATTAKSAQVRALAGMRAGDLKTRMAEKVAAAKAAKAAKAVATPKAPEAADAAAAAASASEAEAATPEAEAKAAEAEGEEAAVGSEEEGEEEEEEEEEGGSIKMLLREILYAHEP